MKRGDFLKKNLSFFLNLRFMRIPLILSVILCVISSTVILSLNAPPIPLSHDFSNAVIALGNLPKKDIRRIGHFSFTEKIVPAGINTPRTEKLSAVVSTENISTRTTAPLSSPDEIKVSNSTDYKLDISDYLAIPPFMKENFSVLIVHTHTTESYTPSEKYNYTPTDTDRTRDKDFNVVRIGKAVEEVLSKNGIKVYHDTTINDYPSYNGSYNRSSTNVQNALKNDPSIKIVLDIHRDAIEGANGEKVKYNCTIDGKPAASVMLVAGSNLSGLSHNDWETNMQFAATLQSHINTLYPGLMRPINFRSQRFNQHLAPGAIIVEVGTNGNTLEEALLGAQSFAKGLADYITKNK